MLKKTMTTVDFGGTERTEDYYFNLTRAEIMEMELTTEGGLVQMINRITAAQSQLELAKLLLTHGFSVTRIYLDAVNPEEKATFEWLKQQYPGLSYEPTIHPEMRVRPRKEENILAIGQKAAWFTGTKHFVNLVEGAGLYGFDGIRKVAGLMIEAWQEEKDPEDLIIRKGWGCESCI